MGYRIGREDVGRLLRCYEQLVGYVLDAGRDLQWFGTGHLELRRDELCNEAVLE